MIYNKIEQLIMESSKNGDAFRLGVMRDIKNEFLNWEKDKHNIGKKVTDEVEIQVLSKMVNSRRKNIENMHKEVNEGKYTTEESLANIRFLEEEENKQIAVLQEFLPKEASIEEIKACLEEAITILNVVPSMKTMGQLVGYIKSKFPSANGKTVADVVKAKVNECA